MSKRSDDVVFSRASLLFSAETSASGHSARITPTIYARKYSKRIIHVARAIFHFIAIAAVHYYTAIPPIRAADGGSI